MLVLWLWFCLRVTFAVEPVPVDAEPASAADGDPAASIEDPRRLNLMAREALESGDKERAKVLLRMHFERQEIRKYLKYREPLMEALVLERVGDHDEAAALFRSELPSDVLRVVQVLRILSRHPDRDALVQEAYDYVRLQAEKAKAGEDNLIYTTSKGAPRSLTVMTTQEALDIIRTKGRVSYCYIEDFDLSEVPSEEIPDVNLNRCVVGSIRAAEKELNAFSFKGFALGPVVLGKTMSDSGRTVVESEVNDLVMRDAVFVGPAEFASIRVKGRRAYFALSVFEDVADFKGAEIHAMADFRFSSFGKGANFRRMRLYEPVYFGGGRYRDDTVFTEVFSERDVYFNSMIFESAVSFDGCEWQRGATFENSYFGGEANFGTSKIERGLNLSRARFHGPVSIKDVKVGSLDAMGTQFRDRAEFMDARIEGRARFSLDEVTRHATQEHIDQLLPLYRHYQGDEDNEVPLTTKSSYGVQGVEDLTARIEGNISFANTVFGGYTVYEGVVFGQPGAGHIANFFNAQFLGETHFERTQWNAKADFTTIFGTEVAFNQAHFAESLVLDDAAVSGRVTLTGATFDDAADLSMYGAEIQSFQVSPAQVAGEGEPHRLFYERCALGHIDRDDVRMTRISGVDDLDERGLRQVCYEYTIDELVMLKDSYGERAMTNAEDDAYWWSRHHEAMAELRFGGFVSKLNAVFVKLFLFELCFGWGVALGNLGIAGTLITVLYAVIYRVWCPESVLMYDGAEFKVRDVSFLGLCTVSLQSLIAINTGWDIGDDDHRFRMLNTSETLIGFIVLTFFVGAYTRMILA